MALVKGTNSYATLDEAETYFEDRLDAAAWTSANDTLKEQALVTATNILNDMGWAGVAVSESQALAFPRVGSYFDPRLGVEVSFPETGAPDRVIHAEYETAYHLLNNDGLLDSTGSVRNIRVGRIELNRVRTPSTNPPNVRRLIKPMLINAGSNLWWRAN